MNNKQNNLFLLGDVDKKNRLTPDLMLAVPKGRAETGELGILPGLSRQEELGKGYVTDSDGNESAFEHGIEDL
nr:4593_t:CDS:2 [Entrophospora candida]